MKVTDVIDTRMLFKGMTENFLRGPGRRKAQTHFLLILVSTVIISDINQSISMLQP